MSKEPLTRDQQIQMMTNAADRHAELAARVSKLVEPWPISVVMIPPAYRADTDDQGRWL